MRIEPFTIILGIISLSVAFVSLTFAAKSGGFDDPVLERDIIRSVIQRTSVSDRCELRQKLDSDFRIKDCFEGFSEGSQFGDNRRSSSTREESGSKPEETFSKHGEGGLLDQATGLRTYREVQEKHPAAAEVIKDLYDSRVRAGEDPKTGYSAEDVQKVRDAL